jgi:hypothetical protein
MIEQVSCVATEHAKDIVAGLLLASMIAGMLLGGWVLLRVMVH